MNVPDVIARVDPLHFLFAAYSVVWIVLFAYFFSLSRRHRRLERELESLRRVLDERGG